MMEDYYESYEPDDIRLRLKDNAVHTFLYLRGTAAALAEADKLINQLKKVGIEPAGAVYGIKPDEIRKGEDGDARWYDIKFDNHVPQIYDAFCAIGGIEQVIYYCYCDFDTLVYSNDTARLLDSRRADFGIPANLEFEEVEDFPDVYDLASTNYR